MPTDNPALLCGFNGGDRFVDALQEAGMANRNDVARLAGVSPAVVSYVLNNSNYVSEEKRKAVNDAIRALGYSPNYFAKSLKTHSGRQLLFVSDDIRNELFLELAYEMENYAFEKGYYVTFSSCSAEKIPFYLDMLLSRQCDGIFVANSMFNADQLRQCAQCAPTVLFQTKMYDELSADISVVTGDIEGGMEQMVHHLVDVKGYRKLFYIASTYTRLMPDEKRPYGDGIRLYAFLQAAAKRGLLLHRDVFYIYQKLGEKDSPQLLMTFLDQALEFYNRTCGSERTAFVIANDAEAVRSISYLQKRGYRIPEDIAVMGFGGTASAKNSNPELSTVSYPKAEIAHASVDILTASRLKEAPVCIRYPMKLHERCST